MVRNGGIDQYHGEVARASHLRRTMAMGGLAQHSRGGGSNPPSIPAPPHYDDHTENGLVIRASGSRRAETGHGSPCVEGNTQNTYFFGPERAIGSALPRRSLPTCHWGPKASISRERQLLAERASAGPVWQLPNAPPGARRAGDLPLLVPGTEGNAAIQGSVPGLSVGDHSPTDLIGRAVVVHNSVVRDPKPEFGGRPNGWIACGVIQQE